MDSLVSSEVGERIDGLLGRKSSRLFVCFCRVLYARKNGKIALIMITIGTWIDSNMMGFFTVVTVRGIVRDSSIYSGLLFDYNVPVKIVRLIMERPNVTSSVYSNSSPIEIPRAIIVSFIL